MKPTAKSIAVLLVLLIAAGAKNYAEPKIGAGLEAYLKKDFETAVRIWRKEAEQGNIVAQFNMGIAFEHGKGVAQSFQTAATWYEKAAKQGHPVAERVIEVMKAYKIGE